MRSRPSRTRSAWRPPTKRTGTDGGSGLCGSRPDHCPGQREASRQTCESRPRTPPTATRRHQRSSVKSVRHAGAQPLKPLRPLRLRCLLRRHLGDFPRLDDRLRCFDGLDRRDGQESRNAGRHLHHPAEDAQAPAYRAEDGIAELRPWGRWICHVGHSPSCHGCGGGQRGKGADELARAAARPARAARSVPGRGR